MGQARAMPSKCRSSPKSSLRRRYRAATYIFVIFFFNDTATTEIYTLSLHDALPISGQHAAHGRVDPRHHHPPRADLRSEEHTSELQSRPHLVCRLLLEKKKENL